MRFFVLALLLLPGTALACPSCAGGDAPGNGKLLVMAGMLVFPWGVAAVVFRTLREPEDS